MKDHTANPEGIVRDSTVPDSLDLWYRELNTKSAGLTLHVDRILESTRSEYQTIQVFENKVFGKIL